MYSDTHNTWFYPPKLRERFVNIDSNLSHQVRSLMLGLYQEAPMTQRLTHRRQNYWVGEVEWYRTNGRASIHPLPQAIRYTLGFGFLYQNFSYLQEQENISTSPSIWYTIAVSSWPMLHWFPSPIFLMDCEVKKQVLSINSVDYYLRAKLLFIMVDHMQMFVVKAHYVIVFHSSTRLRVVN